MKATFKCRSNFLPSEGDWWGKAGESKVAPDGALMQILPGDGVVGSAIIRAVKAEIKRLKLSGKAECPMRIDPTTVMTYQKRGMPTLVSVRSTYHQSVYDFYYVG